MPSVTLPKLLDFKVANLMIIIFKSSCYKYASKVSLENHSRHWIPNNISLTLKYSPKFSEKLMQFMQKLDPDAVKTTFWNLITLMILLKSKRNRIREYI